MSSKDPLGLYFIALIPTGELLDQLWKMKREISEKYETYHALKSPPHVTLYMPFKWKEPKEEALIRHLSKIEASAVLLSLRDFNCFSPRVIYVGVDQNEELSDLYNIIKKSARLLLPGKDASYKDRGFTPHLTLAFRDLKKSIFLNAWEEYREKTFQAAQIIDHFSLLKHNGERWEVFRNFPLKR